MVLLGKEEAQACLFKQLPGLVGILADIDAESLLDVGGAGKRGSGAVAVFGNLNAGSRDNESGGCGNVEGVGVVAACSDNFQHFHSRMSDRCGVLTHGGGAAGNFGDGFGFGGLG